jgi:uncharacterized protein YjaG (DUF416 family)
VAFQFDPVDSERRINSLPNWGQLAFGVLLLERAMPNYLCFEAETGSGGGAMLRAVSAKIWGILERSPVSNVFSSITSTSCEQISPDTEKFSSSYTSSALDAVVIACNLLDYAHAPQVNLLVEAAGLRRDSIDLFLQQEQRMESSDPEIEMRLLHYPLMQEELGLQRADLEFLSELAPVGERGWLKVLKRSLDLEYSTLRMTRKRAV